MTGIRHTGCGPCLGLRRPLLCHVTPETQASIDVLRLQPRVVGSLQEPTPPQLGEIGASVDGRYIQTLGVTT